MSKQGRAYCGLLQNHKKEKQLDQLMSNIRKRYKNTSSVAEKTALISLFCGMLRTN
jgi:hypothetical protein